MDYRDQILEYKNEFIKNSDSLDGTAGLATAASIEDWLTALQDNLSEKTVRPGLVPASTFLGVRVKDNRIVGMIDIRRRLNDYLLEFGGNIGYSVRKSEREKGYAKEMLHLALEKWHLFRATSAGSQSGPRTWSEGKNAIFPYLNVTPNGNNDTWASLKHCRPKGMPMIVIQNIAPIIRCVRASSQPKTTIHRIFPRTLPKPA
jgi:hypothetical protein